MKNSLIALGRDALNSLRDLMPILAVVCVFQLFVFQQPAGNLLSLLLGGLLVVAGLSFFIFGLRLALFPVGERLAYSLARKGSVFWLLSFAFLLGFGTTFAEPALLAGADEAARVASSANVIAASAEAQGSYSFELRMTVAFAVGVALVVGVLRILINWSLPLLIIGGYLLIIVITTIAPQEIVSIAYDLGGVTTSTVTVPLVAALGIGLASSVKGRNPMIDGFGLIALAALMPILFVLIFGIIMQ